MGGRNDVGAGQHTRVDRRRGRAAVGMVVGADIRQRPDAQAEDFSVVVERERGLGNVVARLLVGEQALAALTNPFHRPSEQPGGDYGHDVLVVQGTLHAKAAADVLGDDADLGLGDHEDLAGEHAANQVRALHGAAQGMAVVAGIVFGDAAARLQRVGGDAIDHHAVPDNVVGIGEGALNGGLVAGLVEVGLVVGIRLPDRGRAGLHRVLDRDHGRKRLVVDLDGLGGVLGLMESVGHDIGDWITRIAHALARKRELRRGDRRRAVTALARDLRPLGTERGDRGVAAGEDQVNAGHRLGGFDVDRSNTRVRVWRTQHIAAQLVDRGDVVDVATGAAHEVGVFLARDRLTDSELTHRSFLQHLNGSLAL